MSQTQNAHVFQFFHQSNISIYIKLKMLIILLSKELPYTQKGALNAP